MSETVKNTGNPTIACGDMKTKEENKGIIIEKGTYGPSKKEIIDLAGMEIKVEGYEIVLDEKSGKILRVQDKRTLSEMTRDKYDRLLKEAKRREARKEEIEH